MYFHYDGIRVKVSPHVNAVILKKKNPKVHSNIKKKQDSETTCIMAKSPHDLIYKALV